MEVFSMHSSGFHSKFSISILIYVDPKAKQNICEYNIVTHFQTKSKHVFPQLYQYLFVIKLTIVFLK